MTYRIILKYALLLGTKRRQLSQVQALLLGNFWQKYLEKLSFGLEFDQTAEYMMFHPRQRSNAATCCLIARSNLFFAHNTDLYR